jgi:RNA polymerase sigma factor (sigma-70 family)
MQEFHDMELLRQYVRKNSEEAFAALVTRHVNMVYSAALRKTGNPAAAEEITQAVFVILAKKANRLLRHTALSGWLYQAARLTAANFLRTEIRRARREQEAYMQSLSHQTGPEIWPQIMPLLEDAMGQLGEKDRNALALRFFEEKSFQEIGNAIGVSENAARKRTNYALEKLRTYFSRHGVNSTAGTIAEAISANSVHAAPAALAQTATAVAIAKGATASISTLTLAKGALKVMAWSKTKTAIVAGTTALLMLGGTELFLNHERTIHLERIQGAWEGTLRYGLNKERVVLKVAKDNGMYHAVIDRVDGGSKNLPATTFEAGGSSVSLDSGGAFSFKGNINEDATEIAGRWNWTGTKNSTPLTLKRTTTPDAVPDPLTEADLAPRPDASLQGLWKGTVKLPQALTLRLYFKIVKTPDGTYRAELNSIDQPPIHPIPSTSFIYDRPNVTIKFDGMPDLFEGQLDGNGSTITGKWNKGSPLTLARVDPSDEAQTLDAGKDYTYTGDSDLQGHWTGTLPGVHGLPLHLIFNIAQMSDGSLSATLDSPDQQLFAMPFDKVRHASSDVRLEMTGGHFFKGTFSGGKISGTWNFNSRNKMISELLTLERAK